jgi:2,3-diketo-5-methylthio-1-phosphopentane phosphatase
MAEHKIILSDSDLVLSDFDATISEIDTGLAMFGALGDRAEVAWAMEHAWRRGEINSMECLAGQWGLLDISVDELYALIDSLKLDESFFDFLRLVRGRGAGLAVVSDGLDFYVDRLLGARGLKTCYEETQLRSPDCLVRLANHAIVSEEGILIEFPYCNDCGQCGNCKASDLFRLRKGFARTIYIGDGHSDLCAARYADVIFAKDALAEDCRKAGRRFHPFRRFSDILKIIQ